MSFLKKVSDYLVKNYLPDFSELCVVLPNRRAGLFLKQHIAEQITRPVFLPKIFSIQDFIIELSGKHLCNEFQKMFSLYESYVKVKTTAPEPLEDFLKWGTKLLQDFEDIDQHLADPQFVFTYLYQEKNLALWALDKKPLSEFQKNYLDFFSMLLPIYQEFRLKLAEKNLITYGMACRLVDEKMSKGEFNCNYQKIIFTGLNALTKSEESIALKLYEAGKAEFLWDADEYYIHDKKQEAGHFIRKHLDTFKSSEVKWIENNFATEEKNITIVSVAGNTAQVKFTAVEVAKMLEQGKKASEISVVLNDENLLMPMLNSIPKNVEDFNITMGFPIKLTPIYSFFELIFLLHENSENFAKIKKSPEPLFYHKDLKNLFSHPYFNLDILNDNNGLPAANNYLDKLNEVGKIFYSYSELINTFNFATNKDFFQNLFIPWNNNTNNAIECFFKIIDHIKPRFISQKHIEAEFLFNIYKILTNIKTALENFGEALNVKTLHTLFHQQVAYSSIPFSGEPLKGLQIMGMLETRALDFDTVFMLSVNEGILPKSKHQQSFIPQGIRHDSGLPTYNYNEQIFAYHFYRLLQRSKNIYLIYNTQSDNSIGEGEKSRYIHQIIYELAKYNPKIKIEEKVFTVPLPYNNSEAIVIKKDPLIFQKLHQLAEKGISPSALNTFRKCSLQFYYRYIAELKEPKEISDIIGYSEMGDVLHECLMLLLNPYKNKELSQNDVKECKDKYEKILDENYFGKSSYDRKSGKNYLIFEVLKNFIRTILDMQEVILKEYKEKNTLYKILDIEKKICAPIEIPIDENLHKILLKGKIDRIDVVGEKTVIMDYKTGSAERKNYELNKLTIDDQSPQNDYCFQLMMYFWLLLKNEGCQLEKTRCAVWPVKEKQQDLIYVTYQKGDSKEKIEDIKQEQFDYFDALLRELLTRLFSKEYDFLQTTDEKNCEYCPYALLCGK